MRNPVRSMLLLVAGVALALPTALLAQETITLVNPSFETAGGTTPCTRSTNFNTGVPGWSTDTDPEDSGVSDNANATDGVCAAWLFNNDPEIWQLTDHVIAAGETYTLEADARSSWQTNLFEVRLYYDVAGTRTVVGTAQHDFEGISEPMVTLTLTAAADDMGLVAIGNRLGVAVKNTTTEVDAWAEVDNVRLTVSGGTAVEDGTVPAGFTLAQNYPNPFNPGTTIVYELQAAGSVRLSIHDTLGRTVRTLVEAVQAPGTHEAAWDGLLEDGTPATTGIYLYRLTMQNGLSTTSRARAMLLLR